MNIEIGTSRYLKRHHKKHVVDLKRKSHPTISYNTLTAQTALPGFLSG